MKTLTLFTLFGSLLLFNCSNKTNSVPNQLKAELNKNDGQLFVIERNIPDAGQLTAEQLQSISQTSCDVLDELGNDIKWLHSYVTNDKVFCVYKASNESLIKAHAKKGGFPADNIVAVSSIIDPETANK
ncbi:DUF4242 domain-containing protein [Hyunsoonleella sp. SJ7]|uniref:DUF4242 domain-containing protein n=1 Tax=Hyunsoonleella aquatilis TaxID=2762758 RepID=A0A923HE47_9FLAO|nr:DUF4242 domain-containing protein [Hyunsoonleella aquatilis]MBC3759491.1 DUF4242 domain-containing protein [Hyunsoonleella aquatilis]